MKFPVEQILPSIPGPDREFGEIDDDIQEALDQIDNELMKRGTLNAESLDWDAVAEQAAAVLARCAHLKGFHAAVLALTNQPASADLAKAFALSTYLFAQAWQEMHPKSKRAGRLRDVWIGDIIGNLASGVEYVCKAERTLPDESRAKALALVELASPHGIDVSALSDALQAAKTPPPPQSEKQSGGGGGEFVSRELNARDRAVLRKDIRSVADRITQFDPDAPVAYLMRGYAAWLEHKSLPENTDGVTQQQAMPAFILDEHKAAASDPDAAKLAKLEDRLYMSPDWFEGQKIAERMARKLGHEAVANAIAQRSAERVLSLPGLDKLQYANNKPYVSPEIAQWLANVGSALAKGKGKAGGAGKGVVDDIPDDDGMDDAGSKKPSLEDALRVADDAVAKSASGRETVLAKFALAKEMATHGLKSHARLIFDEILHEFGVAKLGEWDKALLREVQQERSRVG